MPKKTKKEKITAEVHRKDISGNAHHTKAPTYDLPAHISPIGQFQFQAQVSGDLSPIKQMSGELISIQNDLIKTMILALIAISTELLLSKVVR